MGEKSEALAYCTGLLSPSSSSSSSAREFQKLHLSRMATTFRCNPQAVALPATARQRKNRPSSAFVVLAFRRRSDFDGFAKRMASGEAWRDAWRGANDGFERFLFEARKTAERLDRQYSVSHRLSSAARSAAARAREIDRDLEIGSRWRALTMDFSRNWPRVCARCLSLTLGFFSHFIFG